MRTRARDSTALAAGSAVSGLLAYAFFALVTRGLGAEAAAPVSVLWTYWSFAAAALTFPVQHWIVRSVTASGGEGAVRMVIVRVSGVVVVAAVGVAALGWLMRDRLFHRDDAWFPLLLAVVTLGCAFSGVVRGTLSARHRYFSVAWALVGENLVRFGAALVLVAFTVKASAAYGLSLAAGQLVGFAWPSAVRFGRGGDVSSSGSWATFVGTAAGGQVIGQTVLTGGPIVLALTGGTPAQVTALFAGLALFRAPYTFSLGVVAQVMGKLTSLVVNRQFAAIRKVRAGIVVLTAAGVVTSAFVGYLAGPWLVRAIFGSGVELSATVSLLTAIGSAVALGNLALTIMVMAQDRPSAVVRSWLFAALAGGLVLLLVTASPIEATCLAFVVAELSAFTALLVEEIRGARSLAVAETMAS